MIRFFFSHIPEIQMERKFKRNVPTNVLVRVLECFAWTIAKRNPWSDVRITTNNAENDTVNVLTIYQYFEWK